MGDVSLLILYMLVLGFCIDNRYKMVYVALEKQFEDISANLLRLNKHHEGHWRKIQCRIYVAA